MDFTYTEEQRMMKDAAHGFLEKVCPNVEWYLEMDKDEKGYTDELWQGMAELGWMGIAFPEEYGGIGGDFLDLIVLLEEMGYKAVPGPFFSSVILGGYTILEAGSEDQKQEFLSKISTGELIMTMALTEPGTTRFNPFLIETEAKENGDGYTINGTKLFVSDANVSDYMIVAARTGDNKSSRDGITLFVVDSKSAGIEMSLLRTVAGDKQCEVVFNNVKISKANVLGKINEGAAVIEKTLQKAAVGKSAEMLGGCHRVMEISVAYAKERVQFGKPIGMFQAVQHHCANMKMATEQSIFITYKAAWMIANDMEETPKFAAVAKTWVSDAYKKIALIGHQILGGTGYIIEHEMPIYSRRAKAGEYAFGNPNYQRDLIATRIGL
ncbi:MAG: acyl-CoA/acyl-ACP dehydrogenase [Deltaproteobacteria bacterium]|nr:acyl-CoA/acyl-ACP dehydrogenase [Deltaproteobacteria bacterium]